MAIRRISDLPYLYTAYPEASLSNSLMEISYTPGNSIYQSFCQDISSILKHFTITENMIPHASYNNFGVVKIGRNIEVNNGIISVNEAEVSVDNTSKMGVWYKPPSGLSCIGTDANGNFIPGDVTIKIQNIVATDYAMLNVAYPIGSLYIRTGDNLAPPGVNTLTYNNITKANISTYYNQIISGAICIESNDDNKTAIGHMQWVLLPQNLTPWSTWQKTEIDETLSAELPIIDISVNLSSATTSNDGSHSHTFSMRKTGAMGAYGNNGYLGSNQDSYNTITGGAHRHQLTGTLKVTSSTTTPIYKNTNNIARPTSYGVVIWKRIEDYTGYPYPQSL